MNQLKVKLTCRSVSGKVRNHNEDNICFFGTCLPEEHSDMEDVLISEIATGEPYTVAVFDGMGGEQAGEKASHIAAAGLVKYETADAFSEEELRTLIRQLNAAVCEEKHNGGYRQIGTTVAMLAFDGDGVWAVNVGDSPIFLMRDGQMQPVSVSHTGMMGRRRVLTQCLGIDEEEFLVEPHIARIQLAAGDRWLICSDGLTDMVSEPEIRDILGSADTVSNRTDRLISAAMDKGGRDNITVILAEVCEGSGDAFMDSDLEDELDKTVVLNRREGSSDNIAAGTRSSAEAKAMDMLMASEIQSDEIDAAAEGRTSPGSSASEETVNDDNVDSKSKSWLSKLFGR